MPDDELLTLHALLGDALTTLEHRRDTLTHHRAGRHLSLAITHLEDVQHRLSCAIALLALSPGQENEQWDETIQAGLASPQIS